MTTNGTPVDLQGEMRFRYALNAAWPAATYPNKLKISAPFSFTGTDMTNNPGKKVTMGLYVAASSWFPAGKKPKPSEIIALGDSKLGLGWADYYWSTIPAGTTETRTFNFTNMNLTGLTEDKWWVLVTPVAVTNISGAVSVSNMKPLAGVSVDSIGRVSSFMNNQSPTKPVITSPSSGTIYAPGSTISLTYDSNDPDEVTPDDADRYNRDLAAVQFQYAPIPTPTNPNPTWLPLPLKSPGGLSVNAEYCRGAGSTADNSVHASFRKPLLTDLKIDIQCGVTNAAWLSGKGLLPGGDWQIRMRTFDFGHPYPGLVDPLGNKLTSTTQIILNNYPSENTSPWSDPIRVSIPSQVPPPIPTYPTQDLAISEGETVRLSWQYRNTFSPPYAQGSRTVQIRRVGEEVWHTIFDGAGSDAYVDLPPFLDYPDAPPVEYIDDGTFEAGTLAGFARFSTTPSTVLTNVNDASKAYAGNRSLNVSMGGVASSAIERVYDVASLDPAHDLFTFTCQAGGVPSERPIIAALAFWADASDVALLPPGWSIGNTGTYGASGVTDPGGSAYQPMTLGPFRKHPSAAKLKVQIQVQANEPPYLLASGGRFDNMSLMGTSGALSDWTLEATTEYEWRVQVTDLGGVTSNWSEVARFWIVDPANSGGQRPVAPSLVEGATLGCGTHRIEIYRRGGKDRVGELTQVSYVDWGRLRDDISTAKIVVSGWTEDCGNLLRSLETWAYEVVIWRDNGFSVDRVWEGPISLLTYEVDSVTIQAKDVMVYFYRRIIKQQMNDVQVGDSVVNRAVRVLQNTGAPDDPNVLSYVTPLRQDDDAKQYRSTPAYSRTAFEEIDDMAANAGLDYCAIGRAILLWGTKHRIGTLPEFRDKDLGSPPIVSEYGMSFANRYAVSDGNGVWGEATRLDVSGNDEKYGLVEMLSSTWASDSEDDSGTYTQAGLETVRQSFADFAERSIDDRYPPPVVVRVPDNTTLNPSVLLSIQQLVPGVAIPLRSTGTLRQVVATQKLDSIKVVEQGGKETISITMSPFSADDNASGEDGGEEV
jgi:hypothetical protein